MAQKNNPGVENENKEENPNKKNSLLLGLIILSFFGLILTSIWAFKTNWAASPLITILVLLGGISLLIRKIRN